MEPTTCSSVSFHQTVFFPPRGGKTQKYRDYAIFLWKCLTRKFLSAVFELMRSRMGTFFEQATPQGAPVGAAARRRSPTSVTCSISRRSPDTRRKLYPPSLEAVRVGSCNGAVLSDQIRHPPPKLSEIGISPKLSGDSYLRGQGEVWPQQTRSPGAQWSSPPPHRKVSPSGNCQSEKLSGESGQPKLSPREVVFVCFRPEVSGDSFPWGGMAAVTVSPPRITVSTITPCR